MYIKLDKNWLCYTICPYLGIRTKYDRFWLINWAIFRINVELNFDLKFWSGILSKAFKEIGGQILKFVGHIHRESVV